MRLLLILIPSIIILIIVLIRLFLKRKSEKLTGRIGNIATYRATHNRLEDTSEQGDDDHFTDIKSDLELSFNGHFISFQEEEQFTSHYTDAADETYRLLRWLEMFKVEAPDVMTS